MTKVSQKVYLDEGIRRRIKRLLAETDETVSAWIERAALALLEKEERK